MKKRAASKHDGQGLLGFIGTFCFQNVYLIAFAIKETADVDNFLGFIDCVESEIVVQHNKSNPP